MKHILVVGCSFAGLLDPIKLSILYPGTHWCIEQSSGAGNQSLQACMLHQLTVRKWDAILVMLSGINRVDCPVDKDLHDIWSNGSRSYEFVKLIGDTAWYHSGGMLGTGLLNSCPSPVQNYFEMQYKSMGTRHLTDQSLMICSSLQSVLERSQIPYYLCWIYDIRKSYSEQSDKSLYRNLQHTLGQMSETTPFTSLIDFSLIDLENSPFDWACKHGDLDQDRFHPTKNSMLCWFDNIVRPKLFD